jgi:hypothetical protein
MLRLTVTGLLMFSLVGVLGCFRSGASETENRTGFASDREGTAPVAFDSKRAMGYLDDVCKIGTRISGSEGMKKQQELLQKHFEDLGGKVTYQRFTAQQQSRQRPTEMANLIVSWFPDKQRRVILCSHYDTRPIADQEHDVRNWEKPFISANDGGSGVAFLMEMAHHMKDLKTEVGVDFVFFDGEEYIFDRREDKYFFGSEHFAKEYKKEKSKPTYIGAVLLDMIAGKGAAFPVEEKSRILAGPLVKQLWDIAAEQKCDAFKWEPGADVQDDHLALNRIARIPAVDIIDFEYKHWHRLSDVPANCSGSGMEQVSRVLSVWMQRAK